MFPIRDHNPSGRTPYVNCMLLIANAIVFLTYAFQLGDPRAASQIFLTWGLVPDRFVAGDGTLTLFTSMFMHGGWFHIAGNLLFLYIFGDNLEDEMGHIGYLIFYLLSGVGAGLAQVWSDPSSGIPMVGASGAIAGVMGAYLLMYPRAKVDVLFIIIILVRIVPIPAWIALGVWFGLQVFSGAATSQTGGDGVAYWAHVGGFVAGLALALPLWLRRGGPAFWHRTEGHPPHPETQYPQRLTSIPRSGTRRLR